MNKKTPEKSDDFGIFNIERPIRRITFKTVIQDLANTFNLERGIIYTIRELVLRPGKSIRDYLGTGRFKYMNPLKMLLLTVAAAVFFTTFFNVFEEGSSATFSKSFFSGLEKGYNQAGGGKDREVIDNIINLDYKRLLYENMNILLLMSLPVFSFFTYILLSKKQYNYPENLALNAFIIAIQNLVFLSFVVEMKIYSSNIWAGLFLLLSMGYLVYVYIDFFKIDAIGGVLKMLLAIFLSNLFASVFNLIYFIVLVIVKVKT